MSNETYPRLVKLAPAVVIAVAVVGYFVGLQSPMNPDDSTILLDSPVRTSQRTQPLAPSTKAVPAMRYSEMRRTAQGLPNVGPTSLSDLKMDVDLMAEFQILPGEKELALQQRDQYRAFNGAPPTVPHRIDQFSSAACLACHAEGFRSTTFRVAKMSHQKLTNCTQCHVEQSSEFAEAKLFRENQFVGLPAPTQGDRAYEGAPPTIPHSTWMRSDCSSCHGVTGLQGIRATHPWRTHCQQCHGESSQLNQFPFPVEPAFLKPIQVER